jgi:hypothetical protein
MGNLPSSPSSLNGILDFNEIENSDCSPNKEDGDVRDDLLAHAQSDSAKEANDQVDSDTIGSFGHETSL